MHFKGLDRPIILSVVDKFLIELENLLTAKGISFQISDEVRNWIAKSAYDPKYGARPIQRFIQENIKRPLVDEVLFGKLEKGGHVSVTLSNEKLAFDYDEKRHEKVKEENLEGVKK